MAPLYSSDNNTLVAAEKMAPRFAELDFSVSDYIKENENESTRIIGNFKRWHKTNWGNTSARIEYLFERVQHQSGPSQIIQLRALYAVKASE